MRSQKISNKPPRPVKIKNSDLRWAGGNGVSAYRPPAKSIPKAVKPAPSVPKPPPAAEE